MPGRSDLYAAIDERLCQLNDEAFETACLWCEDGFFAGSFGVPDYEAVRIEAEAFEALLEAVHKSRPLLREFLSFARLARQRMVDQFMLYAVSMTRSKTALEHAEMQYRGLQQNEEASAAQRDELARRRGQLKEKIGRLRASCDHRQLAERINERSGTPIVDGLQIRALAIVLGEDRVLLDRFAEAAGAAKR
ncbi:MAG: hypothetical protein WD847_06050 [Pirellulales bacterium]